MTVTAALLIGTAISGAATAYSQNQAGKAEQAMQDHNAKIAENAAKQKDWEARENARRARENNRRQLATIRARLASQGAQVGEGAPLEILGAAAGKLELDVLDNYRAAESQSMAIRLQGALASWEGDQAAAAGKTQAFGTLLSTTASVGGKAYSSYNSGSLLSSQTA